MRMLSEIEDSDHSQVGGKAVGLAALTRADLPVPRGFAIEAASFHEALQSNDLLTLAQNITLSRAPELEAAIGAMRLDDTMATAWQGAAATLGNTLAVRSSGLAEDGVSHSFAGQHDTRLGVPRDQLEEAVKAVWASLYSHQALAYRFAMGLGPPAPGALAVVVQQQLEPVAAGVMFTVNPSNGSWREMVVEAVYGQGESLVSGRTAPHWFLVNRPRKLPRPPLWQRLRRRLPIGRVTNEMRQVLHRVALRKVSESLPPIEDAMRLREGELVVEPLSDSEKALPTLTEAELRELCQLGLRVEHAFGAPMDVEWARTREGFHLLQARPITASGSPRANDDVVYTARFIGERWPRLATPLGWSVMEPILNHFIAYPDVQDAHLGGGPALKLIAGRPYMNVTVFRHLAFKLPGAPPPSFMLELLPPEEEKAWRKRFAVRANGEVYRAIFATTFREQRWKRFRFNPFTNHLKWDRFQAELEAALPSLQPQGRREANVALLAQHIDWIREYCSVHVCSLLFANLWYQLLDAALATWVPTRRGELMKQVATCPPGNQTVHTNAALHSLAQAAGPDDIERLAAGEELSEGFRLALSTFLDDYGHRSEASWELMSPRWARHPERLAPLLAASLGAKAISPAQRAEEQEEAYAIGMAKLRGWLSGPRLTTTELLVHYVRRYLLLRENQRFWFDKLMHAMQGTVLAIGADAAAAGAIDSPEDIALLTLKEVRAQQFDSWRELIARRANEQEAAAATSVPTFVVGDEAQAIVPGAGRLQGLPISPGQCTGKARVLRSVSEGHLLQPGEILVARSVDPSWTPLFLVASGVVLEMGSVLSHGAVVAREYGIPGVVNLDGICDRITTGQSLTLDGTRGTLWIAP